MKRTVGFHVHPARTITALRSRCLAEVSWRRLRQGSDALDARGRLAAKRVRHHSAAFPQVHDQSSLMPLSARCPIIEAFLG
jgi:hypothetical protein